MSKSESMFDVYLLNGRLIKSVDFTDIMETYGEPSEVSPDGTIFVFMQPSKKFYSDDHVMTGAAKNQIKEYMTVSILKLTIFGFTHIKDINILKEIKKCLMQEGHDPSQPDHLQFKM
jgi:hypothetical protein